MKRVEYVYDVNVELTFTREELNVMLACSERHYDADCQRASKQGGFLYGMNNVLTWAEEEGKTEGRVQLTCDRLDTLCKILERRRIGDPEEHAIYENVRQLLREAGAEYRRVNNMPEV